MKTMFQNCNTPQYKRQSEWVKENEEEEEEVASEKKLEHGDACMCVIYSNKLKQTRELWRVLYERVRPRAC